MPRIFQDPCASALSVGRLAKAAAACAAAFILLLAPAPAEASSLDDLKSEGEIGEQTDGYVAAVDASPSAEVRGVVADVNTKRRAKYTEIAAKNGTDVDTVGQLAGEKLVKRAASGTYIRKPGGSWKKR